MEQQTPVFDTEIWKEMVSGRPYFAPHPVLLEELTRVKGLLHTFNAETLPDDTRRQTSLLRNIIGHMGEGVKIIQPFYCDYGRNISIGDHTFINFHLTILDEATVMIGQNGFIGPNVSIYTACHPIDPEERNKGTEWSEPVTIGDNVWIGGSVTILPGVTIGNDVTIGAGSVVVRDLPSNCVAVGNPARVVRTLGPGVKREAHV